MQRLSILNFTPMLQTATSAVEVGTTGLSPQRPHGQLARLAEAGTFTRAGAGDGRGDSSGCSSPAPRGTPSLPGCATLKITFSLITN